MRLNKAFLLLKDAVSCGLISHFDSLILFFDILILHIFNLTKIIVGEKLRLLRVHV